MTILRRGLLALGLLGLIASPAAAAEALTVFAAASLTDAMKDVSTAWEKAGHPPLRLSFGASSTLARQIEQGAPANLFASADQRWMDYLAKLDLIEPATRHDLLANRLVLIVPRDHARQVHVGPDLDLAALLGPNGRIATGNPEHVPVGIYAKQALMKLGLWSQVEAHLAATPDVRGALFLVERGEAAAGIVYATDAVASSGVDVAGVFPDDTHDPITYPFAAVKEGNTPEVQVLLHFLARPDAMAIFTRWGFVAVN